MTVPVDVPNAHPRWKGSDPITIGVLLPHERRGCRSDLGAPTDATERGTPRCRHHRPPNTYLRAKASSPALRIRPAALPSIPPRDVVHLDSASRSFRSTSRLDFMQIKATVGNWFLAAILAASLGGCFHLPNTATADTATTSHPTAPVTDATPLTTLIKERGISPLDPGSNVPLLEQAMVELGKSDKGGRFRGVTYDLTRGNTLGRDWLIQTPNMWNRPAASLAALPLHCTGCDADFRLPFCRKNAECTGAGIHCGTLDAFAARPDLAGKKLCLGQSDRVIDRWYKLIAQAVSAVDITLLAPAPALSLIHISEPTRQAEISY